MRSERKQWCSLTTASPSCSWVGLLHLRIFKVPLVLASSASVAYDLFRTHDVNVLSRGFRTLEISLLFGHETFVGANFGDYHKFMKKVLVMNLFGAHPCR